MITTKHLTYHEIVNQLDECGIGFGWMQSPTFKTIVIRTETGDHYLAAIHREGDVLVFDLGQKVEE